MPEGVAARLRHSCALEKRTVEYGAQVDGTLPDGNHCHLCYAVGEGVELGKVLAQRIISAFESTAKPTRGHDSSANNLIRLYRTLKEML